MHRKQSIEKRLFNIIQGSLILILLMTSGTCFAQNSYSFNSHPNPCYFKYILFSPNYDIKSRKRPIIFVIGDQDDDAQKLFATDKLKELPDFKDYLFVYIPNQVDSYRALRCTEALWSLITGDLRGKNENRFLYLYDSEFTLDAKMMTDLNRYFKSVQIHEKEEKESIDSAIAFEFQENTLGYEPRVNLEEGGTFYIEEEPKKDFNEEVIEEAPRYEGDPTRFDFTLTGTIKDRYSNEPLPFSTIRVKGKSIGASADMNGRFEIPNVPSDTVTLKVEYLGYASREIQLTPSSDLNSFNVELSKGSQDLKTVTIVARKDEVVISNPEEIGMVRMDPKNLDKLPNMGEEDVMRSLQLMPGISASNESSSGLFVRGGTPDQNLVVFDEFTVYHVDHLYGFFSAFNANAVESIELYKGGFESRFGGRLSSVTDLKGKSGGKKFNLGADLSLLSLNGFIDIPIGDKFTSHFTYRRSYQGPIFDLIFDTFNDEAQTQEATFAPNIPEGGPGAGRLQQETTVRNNFYDLNGKINYQINENHEASFTLFNGADDLQDNSTLELPGIIGNGGDFEQTDLTRFGNWGLSTIVNSQWSEDLSSKNSISYSNYFSNRELSSGRNIINDDGVTESDFEGQSEDNDIRDVTFKSDWTYDFNSFTFKGGLFNSQYSTDYQYVLNDTTTVLDRSSQVRLSGMYLQTRYKTPDERWTVTPGLRLNQYEATGDFYFEPRLSSRFMLLENLHLTASTGIFYQFANQITREDVISGTRQFWLMSDGTDIPVSQSTHYTAGLNYTLGDYTFGLEGYYKTLSDISEYSLRLNSFSSEEGFTESFINGTGYSQGFEVLAQRNGDKLSGWISYTFGQARNQFDAYGTGYFAANHDVTHEFKAVATYRYKRFDFSATWIYATGRPYTEPVAGYSVELLDGQEVDFFTVNSRNNLRLPDYHRLDLAAKYKLLKGKKGEKRRREIGSIGLSVFNAYNNNNTWFKEFTIDSGSIIERNVPYLGLTPNISFSYRIR